MKHFLLTYFQIQIMFMMGIMCGVCNWKRLDLMTWIGPFSSTFLFY